jgi:RNA polymerase sigma-70 factor (ECF subfamily)
MRDTGVSVIDDTAQTDAPALLESFGSFYAREYRQVAALASAISGSPGAVEDLTQEAFLAAYDDWDRIGRYADPGAWVRRVLANKCASFWRRRGAEIRAIARLGTPRHRPARLDPESAEIWTAVRRLPRRQAQVVALRYLEDRSLEEIASILECSVGSVKQHLFRARHRLAEDLGHEGGAL